MTSARKKTRRRLLAGVGAGRPALVRARRLQARAATVGFDWGEVWPALDKVGEELAELREALESGDRAHAAEELGDMLFALVNVARHEGLEAERLLAGCCRKFSRRFAHIEDRVQGLGRRLEDCTLAEMDLYWEEAKRKPSRRPARRRGP